MNKAQAKTVLMAALRVFDEPQFMNVMEWVLNGHPLLGGEAASRAWSSKSGVP